MTKREEKKLELLRARAEGMSYAEIAYRFRYETATYARQAVSNAKKYIKANYPHLMPLELQ